MLIKEAIPFDDNMAALSQSADPHPEQQGISTTMPNYQQLHIHNMYIPPRSRCSDGHYASISRLLSTNESRFYGILMHAADYTILSENEATRLPTNGRFSSPDISLASNDIALLSVRSVSTFLASNNLPILCTINSEPSTIDGPRRSYINVKKADWVRYAEVCDEYLAEAGETRTVEQAEKTFMTAVNKTSGLFIPADSIRHFQPALPAFRQIAR